MALSGVEIFKLLPKTNCKKCGFPTCLAFAMKLAQRQATIDACPDVSDEARRRLGEAAAPPIRTVTIGTGERALALGEETVMFRHEKKFVRPAGIAASVDDNAADAEIMAVLDEVRSSEIERVGQRLRVDALCIRNSSGDAVRFAAVAEMAVRHMPGLPLILAAGHMASAEAALAAAGQHKPLLYGVTDVNAEDAAALSKKYGVPLGVTAAGPAALSTLTERLKTLGVQDLVIDPLPKTAGQLLRDNTIIRRAAVKKNFKPLGHPVISFVTRDDEMLETLMASLCVAKYSSIIVLGSISRWKDLALFTLRQNIYTDPQVPMQVEQKIHHIGETKPSSPVIVTTNFSLTFFIVAGEIENSRVPCRLAVMDCEGLSVLTAWAAGKFTAAKIARFITESGIEQEMSHRELIIPGYVAILSGALEEKLPGWTVVVGPREANALPAFLKSRNA